MSKAVEMLPFMAKAAWTLHANGLSNITDLADVLGVSPETVEAHLVAALSKLRSAVKPRKPAIAAE